MKAIINRHKIACVLIGYYDENENYREVTNNNLELKKLPKRIAKNVYLNHDITIHISPGIAISVFAKCMKDIETYLEIENNPNCLEDMLKCCSKYNSPSDDYIWTTIDLEQRRKLASLPPLNL